jgi:hypothetical protein
MSLARLARPLVNLECDRLDQAHVSPIGLAARNRGNSGPTNVKHYLSWSEGTVFNRSCYVGAGTDEVFEAWTRAPQIV